MSRIRPISGCGCHNKVIICETRWRRVGIRRCLVDPASAFRPVTASVGGQRAVVISVGGTIGVCSTPASRQYYKKPASSPVIRRRWDDNDWPNHAVGVLALSLRLTRTDCVTTWRRHAIGASFLSPISHSADQKWIIRLIRDRIDSATFVIDSVRSWSIYVAVCFTLFHSTIDNFINRFDALPIFVTNLHACTELTRKSCSYRLRSQFSGTTPD